MSKNIILTISLLLLMTFSGIAAETKEVEVDGVCYTLKLHSKFDYNIATVNGIEADEVESLTIPQYIEDDGVSYKVIYIKDEAFAGKHIKHLELPAEMIYILMDAFKDCELETVVFPTWTQLGANSFAGNDFKGISMPSIDEYVLNMPQLEFGEICYPDTYVSVFDLYKRCKDESEYSKKFTEYFNILWTVLNSKRLVYFDTDIEGLKIEFSSPELDDYYLPTGPEYLVAVPLDLVNAVPVSDRFEKGRKLYLKLGLESFENVEITYNSEPIDIGEDGVIEIDTYIKYHVYDRMRTGKLWSEDIFQAQNVLRIKRKSGVNAMNSEGKTFNVYTLSGCQVKGNITEDEISDLDNGIYLVRDGNETRKVVVEK